ncbi:MAG: dephospho-CoA kinase [Acidobacteria bacterium]|nr:dephospho-CoA kinase [Acidobacteriota bacterium]
MRVALTGGIATGKSVVARALGAAGVATVDADVLAREAVAPGSSGLAEVVARFGRAVVRADGTLDRGTVAAIVFSDAAARRDLERVVHPRVRQGIEAFFAALPAGTAGLAEIPLAYETGWAATFDLVIVVACRPETQRARLMARDGVTAAGADRRLAAQWPITDKVRLADAVVVTDGDMASTLAQAARLADWLRDRCRLC